MRKHPTGAEYNGILSKTWAGMPDDVDAKTLKSAVKGVWRKVTGQPCKNRVMITRRGGLRRQYNHAKKRWEVLINPKQGLRNTIHDLGHYLHGKLHPSDKPHCDRHLEIERVAVEYVVRRFKPKTTLLERYMAELIR